MFPFSDEELKIPVQRSIEKVRPFLLRDGGDITVLGIRDSKVYVRLEGHCRGCGSANVTLKNQVLHQLRIDIHPDIEVLQVHSNQNWEEIC